MRRPSPLPATIQDGHWYTREDLQALGLRPGHLRRLVSPHQGVFGLRMPATVREDATAVSLVLPPGVAFSHETGVRLRGYPLPQRWDPVSRPPVDVLVPGERRVRLATVRDHRKGSQPVPVGPVAGIGHPVVVAPALLVQMAPRLDLVDLVILADAIVGWRSRWTIADLRAATHPGLPGVVQLRRALALVREGSNSVPETRTRLALVSAGLPEPELNAAVVVDGTWLAYVDFLWRRHRLVLEYYGIYHFLTDAQRLDDIHRVRGLRDHDFRVEEVTKRDLADLPGLVARVARALREQEQRLGL